MRKAAAPELTRWYLLRVLEAARPDGVTETLAYRTLNGSDLPTTPRDVRRELDFLALAGLVEIDQSDRDLWVARLTIAGTLFAQGAGTDLPGIDRPSGGL